MGDVGNPAAAHHIFHRDGVMTYDDLVKKGAACLDAVVPGWRRKVNISTLCVRYDCILNQVFDGMDYCICKQELNIDFGYKYGFALNYYVNTDDHAQAWREAWITVITKGVRSYEATGSVG